MFHWEPEGCYRHRLCIVVTWEPEGHYDYSTMFHWELEGCYCYTKSMAIAPFWFSMEHHWTALLKALLVLSERCIHSSVWKEEDFRSENIPSLLYQTKSQFQKHKTLWIIFWYKMKLKLLQVDFYFIFKSQGNIYKNHSDNLVSTTRLWAGDYTKVAISLKTILFVQ